MVPFTRPPAAEVPHAAGASIISKGPPPVKTSLPEPYRLIWEMRAITLYIIRIRRAERDPADGRMILTEEIKVKTGRRNEFVDITSRVREIVGKSGVKDGVCHVFVPHTTAAVTINEKADPAVASDISKTLEKVIPAGWGYGHSEGNSDSHIKSSLVGASELVIVSGGEMVLGTWQAVFFCEFDGPRSRRCVVRVVSD